MSEKVEKSLDTTSAASKKPVFAWVVFIVLIFCVGFAVLLTHQRQLAAETKIAQQFEQRDKTIALLQKEVSLLREEEEEQKAHLASVNLGKPLPAIQNGVFSQLSALDASVNTLNIIGSAMAEPVVPVSTSKEGEGWRTIFLANIKKFESLVVIRNDANKVMPVVAAQDRDYIYQYLHMMLGQAQWAVLHNNNKVYSDCLMQVKRWTKRYMLQSGEPYVQFIKSLDSLVAVKLGAETVKVTSTSKEPS